MDKIKFELGWYRDKDFEFGFPIVDIYINDSKLLDLVTKVERKNARQMGLDFGGEYAGVWATPYGVEGNHFLGISLPGRQKTHTWVLNCTCGNPGCWDILALIEADNEIVRWSEIANPWLVNGLPTHWHTKSPEDFIAFDYSSIGSYVFNRGQYEDALNQLRRSAIFNQIWRE